MINGINTREIERGWQALEYLAESLGYKPSCEEGDHPCVDICIYAHKIEGSDFIFCRFYRDFCKRDDNCLGRESDYDYELEDCDMCKNCNAWLQVPDAKNIGICLEDFCEKDCEGWCF